MAQELNLHIDPIDTLMFRDGKPFNQNDAGASVASSVFPPYPPTLVGAIRLSLAKQNGFDGTAQSWPQNVVGTGVNWQSGATLGDLEFTSFFVLKDGVPVFPVPLNVVEGSQTGDKVKVKTFLAPGKPYKCDLGNEVRFPQPINDSLEGIKPVDKCWVSAPGLSSLLAGHIPSDQEFIDKKLLWQPESRVGIGINASDRKVNDGQLYMASHVRPAKDIKLYVQVKSSGNYAFSKQLAPLAGEHRMAAIGTGNSIPIPVCPYNKKNGGGINNRYTVLNLSPCLLDQIPRTGERLAQLPGEVVSACLGKMQMIGGWDSVKKQPIPMRPAIPAGSVWFMECDAGEVDDLLRFHGSHIGSSIKWGFGQILIGTW